LICHYCGYKIVTPEGCPSCGSAEFKNRGLGTEKAESDIAGMYPSAVVSRLDGDTASTHRSRSRIIQKLENKETDILVGTQMVVKGMDSDHIRLAGIINADLILNGHDFRSWEKSYQLFQQIMGRLIRIGKQAILIIQTTNPELQIFQYLHNQDYMGFYLDVSEERKLFQYPPFYRLIRISLKHGNGQLLELAASMVAAQLGNVAHIKVLGPESPATGKMKGLFVREIWIKVLRNSASFQLQQIIPEIIQHVRKTTGYSNLTVHTDVDPV
jgi:primosomal protein N' (replication factor Y)